ncbi:uncharacterized protein LOC129223984 [Uloborus diversus]|uniref:uncharacterized protein LOC129223984 n=1 Tax=Uloborus diversus TaxID=327109 RepID=UPI00240A07AC|nr:uncharacterized protein LOC129223984 [Uloborus diversus]
MKERPFGLICIALNIFFWNCFLALGEERDERERQTFVVRYKNGDQTIPVTVVLDYKKQTEYVINMNNRSPAKSVTLYDFKQRTIAYKDLTNRECFLGSLTHETLNEESEALQYIKNPVDAQPMKVLSLDPGRLAMTPTEIRNVAGQKTAVFCRKMTTWMLKPNNQMHNKHKREVGGEEEVEARTYGHHGFHTVRFSHYGHETRRRYHKRTEGASNQETRNGHRKTSSVRPTHNRTLTSWKYPIHHGLNLPDNHLDNSGSYPTSNFETWGKSQESRYPLSTHNAIPFVHHPESNENVNNNRENGHFGDVPFHTTISDDSGPVSRTERETTPMEILPHYFPPNANYTLDAKLLHLYRPNEAGIKYDSSDFHGEIESNVLPLDYSQNYYPYHNNRPISDLESYSSSANDKDFLGKGLRNNDNFYTTDNPVFSNSVLEVPSTTEKLENLHQQEPFEFTSHGNQSPSVNFYRNEIANPVSSRSRLLNTDLTQKEDQFQVSKNYFLKSTEQSNEKNQFLNKDDSIIFSKNHDSFIIPATTESAYEEYTVENFELINNRKPNESEYKLSAKNLGSYESQESLSTQKPWQNTVPFRNSLNPHRIDLAFAEKERLRLQNEHIAASRTSTPTDSFNILPTTEQPPQTLTTSDDIASHHQAKFRNVLKLLKPEEIIIDVERIPTQSLLEIRERFNHKRTSPGTMNRHSAVKVSELPFRGAPAETTQPPKSAHLFPEIVPSTLSPFGQLNHNTRRTQDRGEQSSGPIRRTSYERDTVILGGASNHQKRKHKEAGVLQSASSKFSHGRRNSSFQYAQSHGLTPGRIYPHPNRLASQPRRSFPYHSRLQQGQVLPPGVSMHPRHPQAPYADMVPSNVLHSSPDEQRYRHVRPHRQRHHRRKDRVLNPCCKKAEKSPNSLSCCRGRGSACCSTSRSRTHEGISCCSSSKSFNNKQAITANPNRIPARSSGVLGDSPRNHVDNRDRCQKEKMCRTLYQSTQQVIVCRNAEVNGC